MGQTITFFRKESFAPALLCLCRQTMSTTLRRTVFPTELLLFCRLHQAEGQCIGKFAKIFTFLGILQSGPFVFCRCVIN